MSTRQKRSKKPRLFHLVCDYGPGDLAWSEIVSSLVDEGLDDIIPWSTAANSFDTVSTGFTMAQLAGRQFKNPDKVVIFGNCAPRKDAAAPRKDNEGEGLLYAVMKNGVRVFGVNSGFSLSFLKPSIAELWSTKTQTAGSQFRSRDFFPIDIAKLMVRNDTSFLDKRLASDLIPDYPRGVVGYVDSFGNIKTTIRQGDDVLEGLEPGDIVKVKIGNVTSIATVSGGSFGVSDGDLAFAPGSSGYDAPFWELFQRGGSAYRVFEEPEPGSVIQVTRHVAVRKAKAVKKRNSRKTILAHKRRR